MIDVDNADIGIVALTIIASGCVAAAAWTQLEFAIVKEVILVCVAGIAGQMGAKKTPPSP